MRIMERIVLAYCALTICSLLLCVSAELNDERVMSNFEKRKPSAMWFGPRLGRKKRNQNFDESYIPSLLECEELEEYSKLYPCELIAKCRISDDKREDKTKRKHFNTSPRLGRDSGEELTGSMSSGATRKWLQNADFVDEMITQRSQYSPEYLPRLGRRLSLTQRSRYSPEFSPRLGRRTPSFGVKLGRDSELLTF